MYDTKVLAEFSGYEFTTIANNFSNFNYYNKLGIVGNAQYPLGAFTSLSSVTNILPQTNKAVRKMNDINKEDIGIYADYVGALTKEIQLLLVEN